MVPVKAGKVRLLSKLGLMLSPASAEAVCTLLLGYMAPKCQSLKALSFPCLLPYSRQLDAVDSAVGPRLRSAWACEDGDAAGLSALRAGDPRLVTVRPIGASDTLEEGVEDMALRVPGRVAGTDGAAELGELTRATVVALT